MGNERQWSASQTAAIRERGGPLLVSAGAGSGKTSVLVERVLSRILAADGVDVDRLLIVTFTEAAAAEMRERIAAALRKAVEDAAGPAQEERALRQLHLLDLASISTLHGFCLQAVRAAAGRAGVDPGFRVAAQDEADLLAEAVLDRLLEDWLADGREPTLDFSERFGGDLGEDALRALVAQLHQFARSQPVPHLWLAEAVERFRADAEGRLADASFAPELFAGMVLRLDEALTHLREAHRVCLGAGCDGPAQVIAGEAAACAKALTAAGDHDHAAVVGALASMFAPRLTFPRDADAGVHERATTLRQRAKDLVKPLRQGVCGRGEDRLLAELRDLAPHMETLVGLTMAFSTAYQEAKARLGVVDFSDLEHTARTALTEDDGTPAELARHFRDHFAEIMVDEYQDTSPIQDEIIGLVARPGNRNLFLVGDVKQSIYRFRMAEPLLFLQRAALYEDPAVGVRIDLAENYRSRRCVVDAVNFFFEQLFSEEFAGAAYDERSRMRQGARYPDVPAANETLDGPAELHIVERAPDPADMAQQDGAGDGAQDGERLEDADGRAGAGSPGGSPLDDALDLAAAEREALVAGTRLKQLHAARALVYRPDAGRYEPVAWRDMVVLLRAKAGRIEDFLRVFRQLGVPVVGDSDSGYYAGYEIRLALSLLQIIDNSDQDIPLAAVLRSPVGGFDSTELARVRATRGGSLHAALRGFARERGAPDGDLRDKAAAFMRKLAHWRAAARQYAVPEAVEFLLRKADLLRFCAVLPGGDVRLANLRQLVSFAQNFALVQAGGFGDFVRYLEHHRLNAQDPGAAPALGEQEDVVRVMTIHRSKGLEFPVTVVAGLGQRFQVRRKGRIALHRTLGFGPSYVDLDRREVYATAASTALDGVLLRESLAEEARILYVAMTRAREKLILVGSARNVASQVDKWRGQPGARDQGRPELPLSVLMAGRSALDWIGPCVFRSPEEASAVVEARLWDTLDGEPLPLPAPAVESAGFDRAAVARFDPAAFAVVSASVRQDADESDVLLREALLRQVCEPLATDGASGVPMKLSVSDWRRAVREQEETDGVLEFGPTTLQRRFARPRFVQAQERPSAAERGTLVHAAMQRLDLSADLADDRVMRDELDRLAGQLGWSPAQLAAVPVARLTGFFSGDLGRMVLAEAPRVVRELPFTLAVPARAVAAMQGGAAQEWIERDQVIVQGTADCVILAPDGFTLIDYKTDRIAAGDPSEEVRKAADAYHTQVALYATALSRALAMPAKGAWLYFMTLGQAVPITTLALDL